MGRTGRSSGISPTLHERSASRAAHHDADNTQHREISTHRDERCRRSALLPNVTLMSATRCSHYSWIDRGAMQEADELELLKRQPH